MDYIDAFRKLSASSSFKDWQKKNKKCYLAHFFSEFDNKMVPDHWQVGYYDKVKDTIATFFVDSEVTLHPSAEVFKDGGVVLELDISAVKIDGIEALERAHAVQKKKYSAHTPMKGILILQHLNLGTVWNVTFITQAFAALTVKVDAVSGEVVRDHLVSLFDLKAQ